jgi:uridine kinase
MKPRFLAITGGSGSGKSWLTRKLIERFGQDQAAPLSLDDFYRDLSHLSPAEREHVNFDHPDAIDWEMFTTCLARIEAGATADVPVYDFTTHTSRQESRPWQPRSLVIIEGLWLLHRPESRRFYTASIYLDCPARTRLERRVQRDQRERGRAPAATCLQFERLVSPMHERFVAPQKQTADIVLESGGGGVPVSELQQILKRFLKLNTSCHA